MEDQGPPAWLTSLREQQQREEPPMAEDRRAPLDQADAVEPPWGQADQADVMEDLREQMIEAGEAIDYDYEEKPPLARFFLNLKPWQRLTLAVLLFLNAALCGCMALVMAGRVMLPF